MTPAEVAVGYITSFASGSPDEVVGWVTDDFVNGHASALGSGCVGIDEYRRRLPGFLASMPGLTYDVRQVIADGESVAIAYVLHAAPGATPIEIPGVMVIETRDAKVSKRTDYWDALTYLKQTGQA